MFLGLLGQFGPAFWLAAARSGFFLNGSWISLTVRGQESVPGSIAMMSGLMLGLSIGLGGLAVDADRPGGRTVGLGVVVSGVAALPVLGALLMRFVPAPPDQPSRWLTAPLAAALARTVGRCWH